MWRSAALLNWNQSLARRYFQTDQIAVTVLGPLNGFTLDRSRLAYSSLRPFRSQPDSAALRVPVTRDSPGLRNVCDASVKRRAVSR
jgi:hypothetical protein